MHPRQSVGERLKDARDAHDWTQGDVAERARKLSQLGLSQGRISSFERGAAVPVEAAQVLARVLGVDPGWLSHGEASAAPAPAWWKGGAVDTGVLKGTRARGSVGRNPPGGGEGKGKKKGEGKRAS